MIIKSATASFGKLQNETLKLHDGLNVINAPNESGKSTWCAFFRAMLYGVDSSERVKGDRIPDKLKYAPWSGAPMEGRMDINADRCDITLTRTTRSNSAPMREFKATYTGTDIPVEGLDGQNAGKVLTGVSREVFRRSAFIEQGTISISSNSELEKRIASIVSTGEETSSYSEADARLKAEMKRLRYSRGGRLPELEAELDEIQRKLNRMLDGAERKESLERELEAENSACEALEKQINDCRRQQRKAALETLNRESAGLETSRKNHDIALNALADAKEAMEKSVLSGLDGEEAGEKVREDLKRLDALEAESNMRRFPYALFFLLCLVASAVCATVYLAGKSVLFVIAAAVLLVPGLIFMGRFFKIKNAGRASEEERLQILKEYRSRDAGGIEDVLDEYLELYETYTSALEHEKETGEDFERRAGAMAQIQSGVVAALDFSPNGQGAVSGLMRDLKTRQARATEITAELAELKGALNGAGEKLVLESSMNYLQDKYDLLLGEYDSLKLAAEVLAEANGEIQSRFSPKLGSQAAEYMSVLTGGKYDEVLISRDFKAVTKESGEISGHDTGYLSAGTADLLYLAVRLAVCKLALPEGETCPLIIDDALVNLDNERTQRTMELLREIARERQVILFSCRE